MKKQVIFSLLLALSVAAAAQPFTPGNIVVAGVGSGTGILTGTASPVFLYEYTLNGTLVTTTPLPTVASGGNIRFSQSGNAITEGFLSLSETGDYLALAGYDEAIGNADVSASNVNGVIAKVDKNRVINTSYTFARTTGNAYGGSNFNAAASRDGQQFWLSGNNNGSTGGVYYYPVPAMTNTQVSNTCDTRSIRIFDGALYVTVQAGTTGIACLGRPPGTTGTSFILPLGGMPAVSYSPMEFVFLETNVNINGYDLLYIAGYGTGGGLYKYSWDGAQWTCRGYLAGDCSGLAARRNASNGVDLFITRFDGGAGKQYQTQLIRFTDNARYNNAITDNGSSLAPSPAGVSTLLATAPANTAFGGISFTPTDAVNVSAGSSMNIPAGNYNRIYVDNNATATLTGDITVYDRVESNGTLIMNEYTISSPPGIGSMFAGSANFKIGSPFGITMSATGSTGGNIQTSYRRYNVTSGYEYNGNVPQFTGNGLPGNIRTPTGKLVINNTAGAGTDGVTLSQPTIVSAAGTFVLANGKLTTSSVNGIYLDAAAITVSDYSDNSFVNGPMHKYGDSTYKFPVGKGVDIHPVELVANGNGNLNDFYTVEYFKADPATVCTPGIPTGTIDHVSKLEYWNIRCNQSVPTSGNNQITLWATTYSAAANRDRMVIAQHDAPNWVDIGNGNPLLTGASGPVMSALAVSGNYNRIFTLAHIDSFTGGPLPIHLISFDATKISSSASNVTWQLTAYSTASAKFEVQRAESTTHFTTIGTVSGSETHRFYTYRDNGLKAGINYYRLKMTDADGTITYSRIVAVMNGVSGTWLTALVPTVITNTAVLTVSSSKEQPLDILIVDMQGRLMQKYSHMIATGNTNVQINTSVLAPGVYLLTGVTAEGRTNTLRFIRQ